MRDVILLQGTNQQQSEILFFCNPLLTDVIVPSTIEIDVLWFVDGNNVYSETFNTQEQTAGTLREEYWKMGQTVSTLIFDKDVLISRQLIVGATGPLLLFLLLLLFFNSIF